MSVTAPLIALESTYAQELPGLSEPWQAAPVPAPRLLALNAPLAVELGLDPEALRSPAGVGLLAGTQLPEGTHPVAQAYSGHQFGGFSPRLGDGRALLLGELVDADGTRRDLHLKGSGRTTFARGGDGKAAVGPMLREYVISEAMHALGIPTTRALAVVATGEQIARDAGLLPGAILARVAASHIRVGTFEYASVHLGPEAVQRLADYAIARHHPDLAQAENPYLALLERVIQLQAELIARWMLVGFIHGVMNTDNMTISGETIDYGPCAFLEGYDPAAVFSSIDHGGRYAFGNQPAVAQWNLARLAEALLPLIDSDTDAGVQTATELLRTFPERFGRPWSAGMVAKLGLSEPPPDDGALVSDLLQLAHINGLDYTSLFRGLAARLRGDASAVRDDCVDRNAFDQWEARWLHELDVQGREPVVAADAMDAVNPLYVPRNERVEEALAAATAGDLEPFEQLVDAIRAPYVPRAGLERYAEPASTAFTGTYQTFCGT
jgi:serine/tyrosine/threonine adenylyltransferase